MFHAKAEDGCGIIVADLLLFGIEANALRNVTIAMETKNIEWHFEADGLNSTVETWRLLFVQFVARDDTLLFGWNISTEYVKLIQSKGTVE